MAENKTKITDVDPEDFIAGVEHPTRRADAEVLLELMGKASGCPARMWGPTIVGFGRYEYRYDTGREGEFLMTGFSPRKSNLSIYILPGYDDLSEPLSRLGKHKIGKSCLYVNKLADIDLEVLTEIVSDSVAKLRDSHTTHDV